MRADGTYRWFLGRAVPVRDDAGRIVSWFGTNTDMNSRKRSGEDLDRMVGELARCRQQLAATHRRRQCRSTRLTGKSRKRSTLGTLRWNRPSSVAPLADGPRVSEKTSQKSSIFISLNIIPAA